MNSRSMELLRKKDDIGVNCMSTLSDCDIHHVNKIQHKAHPKKTVHETSGPMELFFTDLMGSIKPAATGGYVYVSKLPTTSPGCRRYSC